MIRVLKSLLNIGLVLFFIIIFSAEARAEVDAPKIIKLTAQEFISLTGTAPSASEVLIYLDGNFIGQTEAIFSCSGSVVQETECQSSWYFQSDSTQKLADGTHAVMAVAQDKTSLVLSAPTSEVKFTVNTIPAPTLIAPNEKTVTVDLKPLIIGLAKDNTSVKIFIDGVLNGTTGILKNDSGTANFTYSPVLNLDRGFHKIWAIAEDNAGQSSPESESLNFKIELPLPAPTILKPVVNRNTSLNRPFIVGLAKNDCKIKVYIDKKYNGELTVKNHSSGTANFAYQPKLALTRGEHLVYTVAIDKRGKQSIWSNTVNFSTKNSAIAESAEEEIKKTVADNQKLKEPADSSFKGKPKTSKQELADKEKAALEKVKSLIGADAVSPRSDRGMVNEGKQNQGRLKLGIVLFILFLVGVVAWLLWVNRELVKERRAQAEAEENKNNLSGGGQDNKLF